MTSSFSIKLFRAAAVFMLAALTALAVFLSIRYRTENLVTTLPTLCRLYSDDAMEPSREPSFSLFDITDAISSSRFPLDSGFVGFCLRNEALNPDGLLDSYIEDYIENRGYDDGMWETLTGFGLAALYDIYTGAYEDVIVIGDVFETRKTTVTLMTQTLDSDVPSDVLTDALITDFMFFTGEPYIEYIISGGQKLACVNSSELIASAASSCDLVIVFAEDGNVSEMIASGADAVIICGGDRCIGYDRGVPFVTGIGHIISKDGNSSFVTLTSSVGVDPILRLYPVERDGFGLTLVPDERLTDIFSEFETNSATAYMDGRRIREK